MTLFFRVRDRLSQLLARAERAERFAGEPSTAAPRVESEDGPTEMRARDAGQAAMPGLDAPGWNDLTHAYGVAADIPDKLRALALSPGPTPDQDAEPWSGLWSSLCHQGDVFTASYAAVPIIVEIAGAAARPIDFSFFALPAAIEIARHAGRGPDLPDAWAWAYHRAIAQLAEAVSRHREEPWDQPMLLAAAAAQAVAKGHVGVAEALLNLDDDWIAKINSDAFD